MFSTILFSLCPPFFFLRARLFPGYLFDIPFFLQAHRSRRSRDVPSADADDRAVDLKPSGRNGDFPSSSLALRISLRPYLLTLEP